MKRKMCKVFIYLLLVSIGIGLLSRHVFAVSTSSTLVEKSAKDIENKRYEVELKIPGKNSENKHDEVILMVDGSYSMDEEWEAMKNTIQAIGSSVLNGSGHTQLTLMAFGMGDNEVLVHVKNSEELKKALGKLPGSLLYGRSSTNCEAGFTGVQNYIESHDDTLKNVQVVYISDGNINTDETPRKFYDWRYYATRLPHTTIAMEVLKGSLLNAEIIPEAFTEIFKERFKDVQNKEELLTQVENEATEEELLAYLDAIWKDVYTYSKLNKEVEYPISVVERAFVKYDKEKRTYIQDAFYYAIYKSKYVTYPNRVDRTVKAAEELAAIKIISNMYLVDYDNYSAWMDTGVTNEKVKYVKSEGIEGLIEALDDTLKELANTHIQDLQVIDYMSKWVLLDINSIRIVNNTNNTTVWTMKEGWLKEEDKNKAAPIVVSHVDQDVYESGGKDVEGNTNGDIYKLIWKVKEGSLLRSETYSLYYDVLMDVDELGFKYNKEYPLNGITFVEYYDKDGNRMQENISVPYGIVKKDEIMQNEPEEGVGTRDLSKTNIFLSLNLLSIVILMLFIIKHKYKIMK